MESKGERPQSEPIGAGVPVVDVGGLLAGDAESGRSAIARQLLHAGEGIGFVTVVGHGVSRERVDRMDAAARAFFALPAAAKIAVAPRRWNPESPNHYRGYFPSSANGKEGFDVGEPGLADADSALLRRPFCETNRFPQELGEAWRAAVVDYFDAVSELAARLTGALVEALGGDPARARHGFRRPESLSTLRLNYYPDRATPVEVSAEDGRALACETHVDSSAMTVLYQDDKGGLQVKDARHGWLEVPPDPDAFVVNLGRVFGRLSGRRLRATPHRVLHTPGERLSIPFFFEPAFDFEISERSLGAAGEGREGPLYEAFLEESLAKFPEYDRPE